jgi:hypothetical protein
MQMVLGSNSGIQTAYSEVFHGFPQSLQTNATILSQTRTIIAHVCGWEWWAHTRSEMQQWKIK